MPTARELLEQADALMRRNRERANDDIPVLTDAVPSPQEARSVFAPPLRPVEAPPGSSEVGDDVPLLTDEVEEIDAVAIDAAVDEGEPSVWDFDAAEPSVIGDAPDSIAIVPPVDLRRTETPSEIEEFDELDDELAAAIAAAPPEQETLQPLPPVNPAPETSAPQPHAPPPQPALIAGGAAALLHGESLAPAVAAASVPVPRAPDEPPAATAAAAEATPAAADAANWELAAPPVQPPTAPPAPDAANWELMAPPVQPPAAPLVPDTTQPWEATTPPLPPAAGAVPNAANWEAMAEEIRMQVLQRIDLFTDTGLRTQLGARLQPIVDRASADLVATINQHVGELLRAYVAEAIEREIDSWRRNH